MKRAVLKKYILFLIVIRIRTLALSLISGHVRRSESDRKYRPILHT